MLYTIKLLSETIIDNIKISEHFYSQMVKISFGIIGDNEFSYYDSVQIPKIEYTKEKMKDAILKKFKGYLYNEKKKQAKLKAFQEEYEVSV